MIHISQNDLENLEIVGKPGKFGTVYRKDEKTLYKIYHPKITDDFTKLIIDNPSLKLSPFHFRSLISRSKNLKYTDGVLDTVCLENKFGGVVLLDEGDDLLSNYRDSPLPFKINLSRQLVRNGKELTDHYIYPTDYRLNNIILKDNEAKIIDIDDVKTHVSYVPNPIYHSMSVNSLAETIQFFLRQCDHYFISSKIDKLLERDSTFSAFHYQKIEEYLNRKEKKINVLFFHKQGNLQKLQEVSFTQDLKCVLLLEEENISKKDLFHYILYLQSHGIRLYDFVFEDCMDRYYNIENIQDSFLLSKNGESMSKTYRKEI